jgi:hypothetical protein
MRLRSQGHDFDHTDPITEICEVRLHRGHEAPYEGYEPKPCGKGRDFFGRFSVRDAEQAGLLTVTDEGQVRARSNNGNPLPWETYTGDMLFWRAIARAVRRGCPEVTMGFGLAHTEGDEDDSPAGPVLLGEVVQERQAESAEKIREELGLMDRGSVVEESPAVHVTAYDERGDLIGGWTTTEDGMHTPDPPDAPGAEPPKEETEPDSSTAPSAEPASVASTSSEATISTSQMGKIGREFRSMECNDAGVRASHCSVIIRRWIAKPGELTVKEGDEIIRVLREIVAAAGTGRNAPEQKLTEVMASMEALWRKDEPEQFEEALI